MRRLGQAERRIHGRGDVVDGVRREVNVGLVMGDAGGLQVGEWVLIHVGFAISKIDEAEAERTTDMLRQLGEAYDQELEQLSSSRIE